MKYGVYGNGEHQNCSLKAGDCRYGDPSGRLRATATDLPRRSRRARREEARGEKPMCRSDPALAGCSSIPIPHATSLPFCRQPAVSFVSFVTFVVIRCVPAVRRASVVFVVVPPSVPGAKCPGCHPRERLPDKTKPPGTVSVGAVAENGSLTDCPACPGWWPNGRRCDPAAVRVR